MFVNLSIYIYVCAAIVALMIVIFAVHLILLRKREKGYVDKLTNLMVEKSMSDHYTNL